MVFVPFPKSKADEYRARIELAQSYEELMKIIADIEHDFQKIQNPEEKVNMALLLMEAYLLVDYADKVIELVNSIRQVIVPSKDLEEILTIFEVSAYNSKGKKRKSLELINKYESKYGELTENLKFQKLLVLINLGEYEEALQVYNQLGEKNIAGKEPVFFPAIKAKLESYKKAKKLLYEDKTFMKAFEILKSQGFKVIPMFDEELQEGVFYLYIDTNNPDEIVNKENEAFNLILNETGEPYTVVAV